MWKRELRQVEMRTSLNDEWWRAHRRQLIPDASKEVEYQIKYSKTWNIGHKGEIQSLGKAKNVQIEERFKRALKGAKSAESKKKRRKIHSNNLWCANNEDLSPWQWENFGQGRGPDFGPRERVSRPSSKPKERLIIKCMRKGGIGGFKGSLVPSTRTKVLWRCKLDGAWLAFGHRNQRFGLKLLREARWTTGKRTLRLDTSTMRGPQSQTSWLRRSDQEDHETPVSSKDIPFDKIFCLEISTFLYWRLSGTRKASDLHFHCAIVDFYSLPPVIPVSRRFPNILYYTYYIRLIASKLGKWCVLFLRLLQRFAWFDSGSFTLFI